MVNMAGLNKSVDEMGKVMGDIERRILKTMANLDEGQDAGIQLDTSIKEKPEKKTPEGAMLRIEQLFAELAGEKSKEKAAKLKEELDRWNLYDLYEDRFLDLFKDGNDE